MINYPQLWLKTVNTFILLTNLQFKQGLSKSSCLLYSAAAGSRAAPQRPCLGMSARVPGLGLSVWLGLPHNIMAGFLGWTSWERAMRKSYHFLWLSCWIHQCHFYSLLRQWKSPDQIQGEENRLFMVEWQGSGRVCGTRNILQPFLGNIVCHKMLRR